MCKYMQICILCKNMHYGCPNNNLCKNDLYSLCNLYILCNLYGLYN